MRMASKLAGTPLSGAGSSPNDFSGNQTTIALHNGKAMGGGCVCQQYRQSTRLIIAISAGLIAWSAVIMAAIAIF